jgi:hypothetical protein
MRGTTISIKIHIIILKADSFAKIKRTDFDAFLLEGAREFFQLLEIGCFVVAFAVFVCLHAQRLLKLSN